jgi:hypothetical protein
VKTITRLTATADGRLTYIDMIRVDVIASGVSVRGGTTQPRAVHTPVLVLAAGIAL